MTAIDHADVQSPQSSTFRHRALRLRILLCLASWPLVLPITDDRWIVARLAAGEKRASETRASAAGLFRSQYHLADRSYCSAQVCVDFDNDGAREIMFASRGAKRLQMLHAANGRERWSLPVAGDQQSLLAYDVDADGDVEILYSESGPGRLSLINHAGEVLKSWESGDWKLGNSPVIIDADHDGVLDAFLGSRRKYLLRLELTGLRVLDRRENWSQCGCYTSAMDVDKDGRWDMFAGSGDDHVGKGSLHRYDPTTLRSAWQYDTNDNASSADPVLVDLDGDGTVEILKSVDNYAGDDAHDALYAFSVDGEVLWKVPGLCQEDSPNAADLDGDGTIEIVGMTFGGEVYCLDGNGKFKWRRDLRPEWNDTEHAYLTPILCDLDGDRELEILAMTNGGFFDHRKPPAANTGNGILFALSATGEVLDRFDVGGRRFWGNAFYCNVDDDPAMELVISGSGGLDVIETAGFGPRTEHYQRRRNYQRLNVIPWAYEDSYFIERGTKSGVRNHTDDLVLASDSAGFVPSGKFTTARLDLPPGGYFDRLTVEARTPAGTQIAVNLIGEDGKPKRTNVRPSDTFEILEPVRIEFVFSTSNRQTTPILDSYRLTFDRKP